MSDVLPWESEEERNHMCMVSVFDKYVAKELRKFFKREWNSRYQARFGPWDDTSVSGSHLSCLEKKRPRPNKKMFQDKFKDGDTNQWDCSVLFDAILFSNSIGGSKLNSKTLKALDKLRNLRNDVKHKETPALSDAEFQTMITDVENAFMDLGITVNDITEMKTQRNESKSFLDLPLMPNHDVVCRSDKIDAIVSDLATLRNNMDGELTYFYISGNPGSGKSQLSRQVCEHLFETVNWELETVFVMTLNAKDTDALQKSYEDFCRRLNCCTSDLLDVINSNETKERKIARLRLLITTRIKFWKKWWIIVDNVEDLDIIYPLLPQINCKDWYNGQIILTIQNTSSVPCDSSSSKHISLSDGMNSRVSRQLLSLLSRTDVNDPVLEEVAEKLDHQPLAIAAASVYFLKLQGTKFSWQDFIRKLEKGKRHIMDEKFPKINSAYPFSMSAAVGLAVKKSAENNFILEETFYFLSLNSFHPIPLDVIVQYIQELNQSCDKEEIYLEIKDCSLFLIENEDRDVRLHRVVHEAIKMSCGCDHAQIEDDILIEISHKGEKAPVNRKVHNVVKALYCFKDRDDKIKIIPHLKEFIGAVKKLFPKENSLYFVWSDLEKEEMSKMYTFFCETLQFYSELRLAVEFQNLNVRIWRGETELTSRMIPLYRQLGSLFLQLGEFKKATEYCKCVLKLCQKFVGEKSFDVANAHFDLASIYLCAGEGEDAQKHLQLVLEIAKEILDSGNLTSFYNALGAWYLKNGQAEEAKNCHEQAVEAQQKDFCSSHDDAANSSSNLSIMYDNTCGQDPTKHRVQRALENVEKQLGPNHVHVATAYYFIGAVLQSKGELDLAKDCYQRTLEIRKRQFGPNNVYVADSYYYLGVVHDDKGELDLAKDYFKRAIEIQEKQIRPNHVDVAFSYSNLGVVYFKNGELDLAKDCQQRALEIRKIVLGPNHVEVANCYNNLGAVYCEKDKLDLAKDCHQQALKIRENLLGPNHVDVAECYSNIGTVHLKKGELNLAKDCHEKELEIKKNQLGPNHIDVANCYNNLGVVYFERRELDLARHCIHRALKIQEEQLVPNRVDLASSYNNLGNVYCEKGELDLAKDCFEQALEIQKSQQVPNHVNVAKSYDNLGVAYYNNDKLDLAKYCHKRALEILDKQFGPNHVDLAKSYNNLANVYRKKCKLDLAKDCYERALTIQKNQLVPNHVDVAASYSYLGAAYYEEGSLNMARNCHQRALEIREKQLGAHHVHVASSYNNLGVVYFYEGKLDLAKNCYQRALQIREKQLAPNHVDVANSLYNLGVLYIKKGELDLAKDCLHRALDIEEKEFGPNHVDVAITCRHLGVVYHKVGELELAKDFYLRAVKIQEKRVTPNYVDVADLYHKLGGVYIEKSELSMAKDCHQQALEIREKQFGQYHVDVADSYNNLGIVYQKKGKLHLAKICHRQALEIQNMLAFLNLITS